MPRPEVLIYTQALCGYCAAARAMLDEKGIEYKEIDVTFDSVRRREMTARSGRSTVPQIFFDNRHIGGFDDLSALNEDGGLDELLDVTG